MKKDWIFGLLFISFHSLSTHLFHCLLTGANAKGNKDNEDVLFVCIVSAYQC